MVTAVAPANIAFIKYWGKSDEDLRLPLNSSISMNLSEAYTTTTVEFSRKHRADTVEFLDGEFSEKELTRVIGCLEKIRERAHIREFAHVVTKNTFPKGTGAAASASGFAALTVASFAALGIQLTEKELTIFARMGSGSACRSIPDGFVEWKAADTSEESYAHSLYPADYWDLRDILVIVDTRMKKVSTTEGQEYVRTSPFLPVRLAAVTQKMQQVKTALQRKDFSFLGTVIEEDCIAMHTVMMTQRPPLFYWNGTTMDIIHKVLDWREKGLAVYFTIDAGPNVHLICEEKDAKEVAQRVQKLAGVEKVIINKPARGAHII